MTHPTQPNPLPLSLSSSSHHHSTIAVRQGRHGTKSISLFSWLWQSGLRSKFGYVLIVIGFLFVCSYGFNGSEGDGGWFWLWRWVLWILAMGFVGLAVVVGSGCEMVGCCGWWWWWVVISFLFFFFSMGRGCHSGGGGRGYS